MKKKQTRKKPSDEEHVAQCEVINWARAMQAVWPELEFLAAWPNGGLRHPAVANRLKAEGVKPGPFDLHLDVPRGTFHGLKIEMKSKTGRLRQDQRRWMAHYIRNGYMAVVCRGSQQAIDEIEKYMRRQYSGE